MTEYDRLTRAGSSAAEYPAETPPQIQHDAPRESDDEIPAESPSEQAGSYGLREDIEGNPANGGLEDLRPLFESRHTKEIQQRWHDVQATFVDDPQEALRQAGDLNDEVVSSLATALDDRKHALEQRISNGDTEQLRIGLRQYHQMLDQILAL